MTRHRAFNWAIAASIALLMASSYLLDGPNDIETAQVVADDLRDATKSVAAPALSTASTAKKAVVLASAAGAKP
jgi:hypothetical protein